MSAAHDKPPQRPRRWHAGWIAFAGVLALGVVSWNLEMTLWEAGLWHEDAAAPAKSAAEIYSDANPTYVWSLRILALWIVTLLAMPAIAITQLIQKHPRASRQTIILFTLAFVLSFFTFLTSGGLVQ